MQKKHTQFTLLCAKFSPARANATDLNEIVIRQNQNDLTPPQVFRNYGTVGLQQVLQALQVFRHYGTAGWFYEMENYFFFKYCS